MSDSDITDPETPEYWASFSVTFEVFIFLLILPVFFIDLYNKKRNRSRKAKYTKRLMLAIFISNTAHQVTWMLLHTTCVHCVATAVSMMNSRTVLRGINLLFFVHRAKLVQGISPIISTKWFSKILPAIVIICHSILLLLSTISGIQMIQQCGLYMDSTVFHFCWNSDGFTREDKIGIFIIILFDLSMTIFLMILFIVPLYRVYKTNLGEMNENQLRQRMKLQRLLKWSVILTLVNQVTSSLLPLAAFSTSPLILLLAFFGKFDPPINVWSSWLMVTRNREFLQRNCCGCCCGSAATRTSRLSRAATFTDVSSGNIRGSRQFTSESTIELPASLYRN